MNKPSPVKRWRTCYADGMLLQADDLRAEQRYYQERLAILTQAIGFGVVQGLEVRCQDCDKPSNLHRSPERRQECVTPIDLYVKPGCAFDALGRELVVSEELIKTILKDDWERSCSKQQSAASELFLCLCFKKDKHAYYPTLLPNEQSEAANEEQSDCEPEPGREQEGALISYQETVELTLATQEQLHGPGWQFADGSPPLSTDDSKIEPDYVPIARLWRPDEKTFDFQIDQDGRPTVPFPRATAFTFTRIINLNWTHGSKHCWEDGVLELTFDCPLSSTTPPPLEAAQGVVEKADGTMHLLRWGKPIICKGPTGKPTVLQLQIDDHQLCRLKPGDLVRLRLSCDFILDEREIPVSGAHLSGRLPSGNGQAGGAFESWFTFQRADQKTVARSSEDPGQEKAK